MTNEEMQRTLEFIIKQQENFLDLHARSEKRVSNLEAATVHLYNTMIDLGKAQKSLTERVESLAERIERLAEAQEHTDQRLNVLIDIVQRRYNGESNN